MHIVRHTTILKNRTETAYNAPEPPAALDNCAKPTDAGLLLKTVYTFFKNVSPTTQLGFPPPEPICEPSPKSKIPPRQRPEPILPRFMSSVLMGQALPPKDMVTVTEVEHAVTEINVLVRQSLERGGREGERGERRTEGEETLHVSHVLRVRYGCPDGCDLVGRAADEGGAGVDSGQGVVGAAKGDALAVHSHSYTQTQ